MNRSRFVSGNIPVGGMMSMNDGQDLRTLYDGTQWLKSGRFLSAGSYPQAAVVEDLTTNGFLTSGIPTSTTWWNVATNGSGTIVATNGDGTNVYVSTNAGATWTTAAHNLGFTAGDVVFGNGLFVLAPSTGTGTNISTSSNGTTWTQRTGVLPTVTGAYRLGYGQISGVNGYVAIGADTATTTVVKTSTDGITWTTRTFPAIGQNGATTFYTLAWNGSLWVAITGQASTTSYATSSDGVNWTARAVSNMGGLITNSQLPRQLVVQGTTFVLLGNGGVLYTSTDGIAWTSRGAPVDTTAVALTFPLAVVGSRLFLTSGTLRPYFGYTNDYVTYFRRSLFAAPNASALYPSNGGTAVIFLANSNAATPNNQYSPGLLNNTTGPLGGTFPSGDLVGIQSSQPSSTPSNYINFVRVK